MNIFKMPSPEMPSPPEQMQAFAMPTGNVKVAQSYDEAQKLLRSAAMGDMGARSVVHTERPRYGHKV